MVISRPLGLHGIYCLHPPAQAINPIQPSYIVHNMSFLHYRTLECQPLYHFHIHVQVAKFSTIESRDYATSPLCMLALYRGSLHFHVTTITDHRMPRGCAISILSLGKTRENQQSKAHAYYGKFASCSYCF